MRCRALAPAFRTRVQTHCTTRRTSSIVPRKPHSPSCTRNPVCFSTVSPPSSQPPSPSTSPPSLSSPSSTPLRRLHSSPYSLSSDPSPSIPTSKHSVIGEPLNSSLDLSRTHIGQVIEVPYQMTVGESQQCLWQSTFHIHDRLYTSTPFAQTLNLPAHPLPFTMVLFTSISMTHVDESREVLDLAYDHAVYVTPAFPGDTFKQTFTIKHLRMTSDGRNTILTVKCDLHNQRQQLIFTVDKTMLYPMITHPYKLSPQSKDPPVPTRSHLLAHLLYNAEALLPYGNLAILRPGQLILHTVARPIGTNTNMSLSTLFRWTHPSIYNTTKYAEAELTVPGGLVLAAVIGASSRGLFECLHETIDSCSLINKVSPVDLIGALSYVQHIHMVKEGFEELYVTTIGVKGIDVRTQLEGVRVPVELFTEKMRVRGHTPHSSTARPHSCEVTTDSLPRCVHALLCGVQPNILEAFLARECPMLSEHVVMQIHRRIVRQSPYSSQRNIPLL